MICASTDAMAFVVMSSHAALLITKHTLTIGFQQDTIRNKFPGSRRHEMGPKFCSHGRLEANLRPADYAESIFRYDDDASGA